MNNTKSIIRAFAPIIVFGNVFGLLLASTSTAFMKRTKLVAMLGITLSLMLVACGPSGGSGGPGGSSGIGVSIEDPMVDLAGSPSITFSWQNSGALNNTMRDTDIAAYNITYQSFTRNNLDNRLQPRIVSEVNRTITYMEGTQTITLSNNISPNEYVTVTRVVATDAAGILIFPIRITNNLRLIPIGADADDDNILDRDDLDMDGDGLIEIGGDAANSLEGAGNLALQLWSMRYNLEGTGLDIYPGTQDNRTGGDSTGCPAGGCTGYELTGSIDLETLDNPATGSSFRAIFPNPQDSDSHFGSGLGIITLNRNWFPIGRCTNDRCSGGSRTQHFSAIFEGNGHSISNMRILAPTEERADGLGFFASIQAGPRGARIRNVHLVNASVQIAAGVTSATGVGGMAGFVHSNGGGNANDRTAIMASSVLADDIQGHTSVGGLVGSVTGNAIVRDSAAYVIRLNGESNLGGLVGSLGAGQLANTFALAWGITGDNDIGSLVGRAGNAGSSIARSWTLGNSIDNTTEMNIHPLAGSNQGRVDNSYWQTGLVNFNTVVPAVFPTFDTGGTISRGHSSADLQDGSFTESGTTTMLYTSWTDTCANVDMDTPVSVWDFGTAQQYPAISCFTADPMRASYLTNAAQRAIIGDPSTNPPSSVQDIISRIP